MSSTAGDDRPSDAFAALTAVLATADHRVLSTDVFDTVVLRDHSTETARLAAACRLAAETLGVDPFVLTQLRWSFHASAYRAVAMERPEGEARLDDICTAAATALGLGPDAARVLHDVEVDVDIRHLRPNRPLLALLDQQARRGVRVIAVSDTYYGEVGLRRILDAVVGPHPIGAVYASADLGLTKHVGGIFAEVAEREDVEPAEILHVGDHPDADVHRARAAGWNAVHLPRDQTYRLTDRLVKLTALPLKVRRAR